MVFYKCFKSSTAFSLLALVLWCCVQVNNQPKCVQSNLWFGSLQHFIFVFLPLSCKMRYSLSSSQLLNIKYSGVREINKVAPSCIHVSNTCLQRQSQGCQKWIERLIRELELCEVSKIHVSNTWIRTSSRSPLHHWLVDSREFTGKYFHRIRNTQRNWFVTGWGLFYPEY